MKHMSVKHVSTKHSNQIDMLHGNLLSKILIFALPLAASSILQQLFNSVDIAVVGKFSTSQAMAAVGSNGSVISLLINLFVGISIGANVVIASYLGRQEHEKVQKAVHTVFLVAVLSGIFLLFLGIIVARPLLILMDTPNDVLDLAVVYLKIYFLGMPFFMIYNFGSAILRSIGDTKRPLYCLIASGVLNICLNLLLVIKFDLSAAGVAIATVVANMLSAGITIRILLHEETPIRLHFKKLRIHKAELIRMVKIGVPAGLQGVVFSLSNVCIQAGINSFGSDAVAGSAAAVNYEYFTYFTVNAFAQATVTFVSQNYAAGNYDRCNKIFKIGMICGFLTCSLMSATFVFWKSFFISFYTSKLSVIGYAAIRMTHVVTLEGLTATYEISGAALRGHGYSMLPALMTVVGSCGFRILWLYTVFKKYHSFEMLMNVYPISWIITGTAVITAYVIIRKKLYKKTSS